jgi:hypothetical protein
MSSQINSSRVDVDVNQSKMFSSSVLSPSGIPRLTNGRRRTDSLNKGLDKILQEKRFSTPLRATINTYRPNDSQLNRNQLQVNNYTIDLDTHSKHSFTRNTIDQSMNEVSRSSRKTI